MNQRQPFTFLTLLKAILEIFDVFAAAASPLVLILFLVLTIIALDGFGTHVQLLNSLENSYQIRSGRLSYTPGEKTAYVRLGTLENDFSGELVYLKYYWPQTLAGLKDGQTITIRTAKLPNGEVKSIFEDAYAEVQWYWGYLQEVAWGYALAWLVLVLHPDFLFLGFDVDDEETQKKTQKGGNKK